MKNIISYAVILLLFLVSVKWGLNQRSEKLRQKDNVQALSDSMYYYKDKNGIIVVEKQDLVMKLSELKKINNAQYQKLLNEAKNNVIAQRKIERLENIIATTEIEVGGLKRDTILLADTVYRNVEYLRFTDKWYDITYIEPEDSMYPSTINVKTYHDLIIIQQWYREGFWLWRWLNRKKEKTTVKDLNPYSTINNFSVINIKK